MQMEGLMTHNNVCLPLEKTSHKKLRLRTNEITYYNAKQAYPQDSNPAFTGVSTNNWQVSTFSQLWNLDSVLKYYSWEGVILVSLYFCCKKSKNLTSKDIQCWCQHCHACFMDIRLLNNRPEWPKNLRYTLNLSHKLNELFKIWYCIIIQISWSASEPRWVIKHKLAETNQSAFPQLAQS